MTSHKGNTFAWERYLRKVKHALYSHVHPDQTFRLLLISEDIAQEILKNSTSKSINEFTGDGNHTWEITPIKVDKTLPDRTAIYIPSEPTEYHHYRVVESIKDVFKYFVYGVLSGLVCGGIMGFVLGSVYTVMRAFNAI